jgi:hypothetical protein
MPMEISKQREAREKREASQAVKDRLCEAADSMDPVVCTCDDCHEFRVALAAYRKLKGEG